MGFLSVKSGLKGPEVRTPTPPTVPLAGLPQQAQFLTLLIFGSPDISIGLPFCPLSPVAKDQQRIRLF